MNDLPGKMKGESMRKPGNMKVSFRHSQMLEKRAPLKADYIADYY